MKHCRMKQSLPWLCLLACVAAQAQEPRALPVPNHDDFVLRECAPAMTREVGDEVFARAACECSYRLLSDRRAMTREEFDAAATLCRAEYEQDGARFLDKYGD
jgi:hypothetical protein